MLELREDPVYENVQTCHAYVALDAAMQIQKKKVIVGPSDAVGILLFNTVRDIRHLSYLPVSDCCASRPGKQKPAATKARRSRRIVMCTSPSPL
jgi:hypothetical protein